MYICKFTLLYLNDSDTGRIYDLRAEDKPHKKAAKKKTLINTGFNIVNWC